MDGPHEGQAASRLLTDSLRAVGRLVVDGVRTLLAHWPELLGLFLIGWAARMAFLWATTVVSNTSALAAVLLLPLAPLATLLSMVLMLRAMAPTLPAFSDVVTDGTRRDRWRDDLQSAGQVLIPFLGVYASAGMLKEDSQAFLYDSTMDEMLNAAASDINWGRADYASGWALVGLVVLALVLRKLLSLSGWSKRSAGWAFAATYLETLWMVAFAQALSSQVDNLAEWVTTRRATVAVLHLVDQVSAALIALGAIPAALVVGLGTTLQQLGNVIVLPVAWLAIGATVYGYSLKASELRVPTHEDINRRIERVPSPVRRVVGHAVEPVTTPVRDALAALGKIASAGVVPMVLFCVTFVIAGRVQVLTAEVMRLVVGPQDLLVRTGLTSYVSMAERGVHFLVVLSLLGAAVNAIVLSQREDAGRAASADEREESGRAASAGERVATAPA